MGAMLSSSRVLVKDKASKIAGSDNLAASTVVVKNRGSEPVDLGGSGVKTGEGYELKAGEREEFVLGGGNGLYAVAPSGKEVRLDVIIT